MSDVTQNRLENMMIGESVVYMDFDGTRRPATIIKVYDQSTVDLIVQMPDLSRKLVVSVLYSASDAPNHWWRRIKF